jgi:diketogulonate reductase-like aldo/keto reductase
MHTVKANGADIPALGFGTWDLNDGTARDMVRTAIEIGYRHIDTAVKYANETDVGAGIKDSGIARGEIFLTTKIWPTEYEPKTFRAEVEASLGRLGVDYVDLLLLHWPNPDRPMAETIGVLNAAKKDGLTRHIGVSNFTTSLLAEAVRVTEAPLATNQIEYHPYLNQDKVLAANAGYGLATTAFCPVARGRVFKDAKLQAIAKKYDRGVGQIVLHWLVQQPNVIAIPRTGSPAHAKSNFEIFDFTLDDDDMAAIAALAEPDGRITTKNRVGFAPEWDT